MGYSEDLHGVAIDFYEDKLRAPAAAPHEIAHLLARLHPAYSLSLSIYIYIYILVLTCGVGHIITIDRIGVVLLRVGCRSRGVQSLRCKV